METMACQCTSIQFWSDSFLNPFSRTLFGVSNITHLFFSLQIMAIESFPIPSLDRPFGVHLWPHFSRAFELVAGYPADEFKFVVGTTPMSTLRETSIFVAVYYTIIFGGREVMRNRAPFKLRSLFLVHNFYLTAISAILLALYIEELVPTVFRRGIFYAICHRDGGWTDRLVVLYYVGEAFTPILHRPDAKASSVDILN